MDLAKLVGGSGIVRARGLELESKDGITVRAELDTITIPIDGLDQNADQRVSVNAFTITITPTGKWINADRLYPYINYPLGRLVLPVLAAAINTGTDVLTSTDHRFYTGDRVMVGIRAGGTLPTSAPQVDEDSWYYVRVATEDTYTLHTSRAGALANTGKVDFSAAGTSVVIIGQFDLEIIGEDGDRITFHAAVISEQPDMNQTRTETPFGQVTFRAFVRNRKRTNDADAFYTIDSPGFPGWTANAQDIKTQSPWVAWADQLAVSAISVDDDELTIGGHGMVDGVAVYVGSTGTLPTAAPALNPETKYFINAATADAVTLHVSEADALSGDDPIDLTGAGTGVLFLTVDNAPFTLMDTETGVQLSAPCDLADRESDRDGVYNARLTSASLEVRFIALGLGVSQVLGLLKMQGPGATLGRSLSAGSRPLSIFSAGIFVRVNGAAPKSGDLGWNMSDDRARELNFVSTRVVQNGVVAPLGTIGTDFPA